MDCPWLVFDHRRRRFRTISISQFRTSSNRALPEPTWPAHRGILASYNGRIMRVLLGNVSFAVRMLSKNPGLVLAAILTLALAIGVNTAMFSVTSALLLRPFPYADPQQLVTVEAKDQSKDFGGT